MKKILLVCLLAVFPLTVLAKQFYYNGWPAADLDKVQKAVQDTAYYNDLERRFFNLEYLKASEVVDLYYGQMYQEDYAPYDTAWKPKIDKLVEQGNLKKAIEACINLRKQRPAYLPLLDYHVQIYEAIYQTTRSDRDTMITLRGKQGELLTAVLASGMRTESINDMGKSTKCAFIVASPNDERMFIDIIFWLKEKQDVKPALVKDGEKSYDVLYVEPKIKRDLYKGKEVYFDITVPLSTLSNTLKDKKNKQ